MPAIIDMVKVDRHVTYPQIEGCLHISSAAILRPPSSKEGLGPLGTTCIDRGAGGTIRIVEP